MKRLSLIFAIFLCVGLSAFAEKKADALRLTLKAEAEQPIELLFRWAPVITYSADRKSIILSCEGDDPAIYALDDVLNLTFFNSEGKLENIESAFADDAEQPSSGTFTLDGKRLESITAPGMYIINGKKVLVK